LLELVEPAERVTDSEEVLKRRVAALFVALDRGPGHSRPLRKLVLRPSVRYAEMAHTLRQQASDLDRRVERGCGFHRDFIGQYNIKNDILAPIS